MASAVSDLATRRPTNRSALGAFILPYCHVFSYGCALSPGNVAAVCRAAVRAVTTSPAKSSRVRFLRVFLGLIVSLQAPTAALRHTLREHYGGCSPGLVLGRFPATAGGIWNPGDGGRQYCGRRGNVAYRAKCPVRPWSCGLPPNALPRSPRAGAWALARHRGCFIQRQAAAVPLMLRQAHHDRICHERGDRCGDCPWRPVRHKTRLAACRNAWGFGPPRPAPFNAGAIPRLRWTRILAIAAPAPIRRRLPWRCGACPATH